MLLRGVEEARAELKEDGTRAGMVVEKKEMRKSTEFLTLCFRDCRWCMSVP